MGIVCALAAVLVVAGCGSSSSSSSAPGVTATSDHVRHPPAADRPGRSRLQRDRSRLAGVLRLPQRPGRHQRAQDQPDHQERRIQPDADGQRRRTNWCSTTTCSGSSRASARRRTRRSSASSTAQKVPDMFVASGCACWENGTAQPYTFGWQPNYTIEGKILGQLPQAALRRQEGRRLLPGRRLRHRWAGGI